MWWQTNSNCSSRFSCYSPKTSFNATRNHYNTARAENRSIKKRWDMWFEYLIDAFVEQFPIFMIVITISGLAGLVKLIMSNSTQSTQKDRSYILGAGLFALFVGLIVFPIETFQMLEAIRAAGDQQPSIVMGGFYLTFVPMFYGLFWFLISLAGWLYYKRKATTD